MRIPKTPGELPMHPLKLAATASFMSVALATAAFAAPTTFTSDANHTFVRFSYNHLGFSTQESRFNKVSGTVTYDPAAKTAAVDVVIDAKSVDTGSDLFNGHIQGDDYLDTAKHPTATFKSTSVKFDGDKPVSIEGNLTVKGVTKPVSLTVTSFKHGTNMMKKDGIGADATGTVKRSDFNMGKAVPLVSDEVTLEIVIEAAAP
jgi:polyisoprenoid-binding protein YceI